MSNDDQIGSRRVPRQGVGGSPVGSGLTIALAAVALIAGFFILRDLNDDAGSASGSISSPADDATDPDGSTVISIDIPTSVDTPPVETDPPRTYTGATVIVANANTTGGSAGQMTGSLELEGYVVGDPADAAGANLTESVVYYAESVAGAQVVAESVALDLGGVEVLALPVPPPVAEDDLGDAGVVVMLGDAQAGQSIADLTVATDESAGGAAAPDPSDGAAVDTTATDADTVEE